MDSKSQNLTPPQPVIAVLDEEPEFYRPKRFASGHGEQGEPATAPPVANETSAGNSSHGDEEIGARAENTSFGEPQLTTIHTDARLNISPSTMAGIPAQSSVESDGETVRSGGLSPGLRKSSIPEGGFKRPRSFSDYRQLADLASDILFASIKHLTAGDRYRDEAVQEALAIMSKRHADICAAFCWLGTTSRYSNEWKARIRARRAAEKKQAGAA